MKCENEKNTLLILSSPLNRYMHQDWEWIINIKTILYIIKHAFYFIYFTIIKIFKLNNKSI